MTRILRTTAHLVAIALALALATSSAGAQTVDSCGGVSLASGSLMARLFTDSAYASERARLGLDASMLWKVRALTQEKGGATCAAIQRELNAVPQIGLAAAQLHFFATDVLPFQFVTVQLGSLAAAHGAGNAAAQIAVLRDRRFIGVVALRKKG